MLSFLRKLFGRRRRETPHEGGIPLGEWVPAAENPFGVDVFDCAVFCQSVVSKDDPTVAESFQRLRSSSGEEYRGRLPDAPVTVACDLTYPYDGRHQDGPLFKAEQVEDRWDVYLYDGKLSFARSGTGDLAYVGGVAFEERDARLTSVTAARQLAEEGMSPVAVVDFLIKSHLHGMMVPHPLPKDLPNDPRTVATWSFAQYGRRAFCGTYADTLPFRVPRLAPGGPEGP